MKSYFFTIFTMARINFRRYLRDRTALFFTIAFPLIFLVIFGSLFGKSNSISFNVGVISHSSTVYGTEFMDELKQTKIFKIAPTNTFANYKNELDRGQLDGIVILPSSFGQFGTNHKPQGNVEFYYSEADSQSLPALNSSLTALLQGINAQFIPVKSPFVVKNVSISTANETYFDYLFAGMLGFTIMSLGLFGPTRSIPQYKKQGILRRLHTTPLSSVQYVISSVLTYTLIAILAFILLFIVGLKFYHLDMRGDYLELFAYMFISLATIFGFGLAIGGWAKDEDRAAPLTNLVSFPMMFLSGVFFPTYIMPLWLQKISTYLPLTPVINGIRMIVTENKHLYQLGPDIGLIVAWLVVIYLLSFKVFKWE